MPACRTSVICNIISASTMTAMRESTPQGREGGRETACLSKRGTFFVLIRKYNEPLKKQEKKISPETDGKQINLVIWI